MAEKSTFFDVLHEGTASVRGFHHGFEKGGFRVRYKTVISFESGSHCTWSRYTDFRRLHKNLKNPVDSTCKVCCAVSDASSSFKFPSRIPIFASVRGLAEKRIPVFSKFISDITQVFSDISHEELQNCESHRGAGTTLRNFWHLGDYVEEVMAYNDQIQGTIELMKASQKTRGPTGVNQDIIASKLRCEVVDHYVFRKDKWCPVTVEYYQLGDEGDKAGRLKIVRNGHKLVA